MQTKINRDRIPIWISSSHHVFLSLCFRCFLFFFFIICGWENWIGKYLIRQKPLSTWTWIFHGRLHSDHTHLLILNSNMIPLKFKFTAVRTVLCIVVRYMFRSANGYSTPTYEFHTSYAQIWSIHTTTLQNTHTHLCRTRDPYTKNLETDIFSCSGFIHICMDHVSAP